MYLVASANKLPLHGSNSELVPGDSEPVADNLSLSLKPLRVASEIRKMTIFIYASFVIRVCMYLVGHMTSGVL